MCRTRGLLAALALPVLFASPRAQLAFAPPAVCAGEPSQLSVAVGPNELVCVYASLQGLQEGESVAGIDGLAQLAAPFFYGEFASDALISIPTPVQAGLALYAQPIRVDTKTGQASFGPAVALLATKVVFQTTAKRPLASPHRIGISVKDEELDVDHDRTQRLRAVVSPPEAAPAITLMASEGLKLTPIGIEDGVIEFDLEGTEASEAKGDRTITALHAGGACGTAKISVVIPFKLDKLIGKKGKTARQNTALNKDTVPALYDIPSDELLLVTMVVKQLPIRVLDQFGDKIGKLYEGAVIWEDDGTAEFAINVSLRRDSTYLDTIGVFAPGDFPVKLDANNRQHQKLVKSWKKDKRRWFNMKPTTKVERLGVMVDGFELQPEPAIPCRVVELRVKPGSTSLYITYPKKKPAPKQKVP